MHMMHVMILSMQMMQMHVLSICMYARPTPEQTIDAAPGKSPMETAVSAAKLVKGDDITVFAWGFGDKMSSDSPLKDIATESSKARFAKDLAALTSHLVELQVAVCGVSPPPP